MNWITWANDENVERGGQCFQLLDARCYRVKECQKRKYSCFIDEFRGNLLAQKNRTVSSLSLQQQEASSK